VTIAHHQGVALLVALSPGCLEVGFDFSLEGLGEHPFGTLSGDGVEIKHELFARGLLLVYSVHRCVLPADAATSALPIDYSERKVHHVS
jgi:hypothetical protein